MVASSRGIWNTNRSWLGFPVLEPAMPKPSILLPSQITLRVQLGGVVSLVQLKLGYLLFSLAHLLTLDSGE